MLSPNALHLFIPDIFAPSPIFDILLLLLRTVLLTVRNTKKIVRGDQCIRLLVNLRVFSISGY